MSHKIRESITALLDDHRANDGFSTDAHHEPKVQHAMAEAKYLLACAELASCRLMATTELAERARESVDRLQRTSNVVGSGVGWGLGFDAMTLRAEGSYVITTALVVQALTATHRALGHPGVPGLVELRDAGLRYLTAAPTQVVDGIEHPEYGTDVATLAYNVTAMWAGVVADALEGAEARPWRDRAAAMLPLRVPVGWLYGPEKDRVDILHTCYVYAGLMLARGPDADNADLDEMLLIDLLKFRSPQGWADRYDVYTLQSLRDGTLPAPSRPTRIDEGQVLMGFEPAALAWSMGEMLVLIAGASCRPATGKYWSTQLRRIAHHVIDEYLPDPRGRHAMHIAHGLAAALRALREVRAQKQRAEQKPQAQPMPALVHHASMQSFYRFAFMPNGYPGRLEEDGSIYAHPIYGTYVLEDYLRQHARNPSQELRDAIRRVANAALEQMEPAGDALAFWYDAAPTRGARLYRRHYSGLTQSYYAVHLARAAALLEDQGLQDSAAAVFRSLLVPVEDGGVLHRTPAGPVIAEVPQQPNSWILNGWLSALQSVHDYAEATGSEQARSLLLESAGAAAHMLPLYDLPDLKNSRYGLTGFTFLRLVSDTVLDHVEVAVDTPGEGVLPAPIGTGTRWQTYTIGADFEHGRPLNRTVRINAVLSAGGDAMPRLLLRLGSNAGTRVIVQAMRGSYDPLASAPVATQWQQIGVLDAVAGTADYVVAFPADLVNDVVYPTTFVKKINDKNANVYHSLHVSRLHSVFAATQIPELHHWAEVWNGYLGDWSTMPMYSGLAYRVPGSSEIRDVNPPSSNP